MWESLRENVRRREELLRPDMMDKYNSAVDLHLNKFLEVLENGINAEGREMESLWVDDKDVKEFKNHLEYALS
jgi:hypothetical protein